MTTKKIYKLMVIVIVSFLILSLSAICIVQNYAFNKLQNQIEQRDLLIQKLTK